MRATAGSRFVVITSDKPSDGFRELGRECGAIGRRAKPDFGIECEGREVLALFLGASEELGYFTDDAGGECNHVARRETIRGSGRIAGDVPHGGGRNDVGRGRGHEASLDEASPSTLLDGADEPVGLERTEVIVHLLPWKANAVGERRCGSGMGQFGQEA